MKCSCNLGSAINKTEKPFSLIAYAKERWKDCLRACVFWKNIIFLFFWITPKKKHYICTYYRVSHIGFWASGGPGGVKTKITNPVTVNPSIFLFLPQKVLGCTFESKRWKLNFFESLYTLKKREIEIGIKIRKS